jgi:NADH:ubiquinone oxidoreductase subunit 3 (subunit A)
VDILLSPPIAFLLYIPLVLILTWIGRQLAGPGRPTAAKSSGYAAGEKASTIAAAPGYRPFFLVAFFFAILHLGMLVLGVGDLNTAQAAYIIGLGLALIALILG